MSEFLLGARRVLGQAHDLGFLGPVSTDDLIEHSLGFVDVILGGLSADDERRQLSILDLGSGSGVPGLIVALCLEGTTVTLLDGSTRRSAWLSQVVSDLQLADRVQVVCERAEAFGRKSEGRGRFDLVTSRAFGPPAVVAECAAPLLRLGGRLIVSEPPSSGKLSGSSQAERWPPEGLARFGYGAARPCSARSAHFVEVTLLGTTPDRYPRRVGIPQKRPEF